MAHVSYPVFIICRDRCTSLVELIGWLEALGQAEIYLMDNASTWPALLDYYDRTSHTVLRAGENAGHTVGWSHGYLERYARGRRFILTDPDLLPDPQCPPDVIDRMTALLDSHPEVLKAGCSLRLDDLPDVPARAKIFKRELRYWQDWDPAVHAFRAPIDTTFALHSPRSVLKNRRKPAYRLPEPYVMRHLPWYIDPAHLTAEEAYYRTHARSDITHWAQAG